MVGVAAFALVHERVPDISARSMMSMPSKLSMRSMPLHGPSNRLWIMQKICGILCTVVQMVVPVPERESEVGIVYQTTENLMGEIDQHPV